MMQTRTPGNARQNILDKAMDLASVEGLEGLSIGRLAEQIGMSKSGVMGHFASKEDLQLHTVDAARAHFERAVLGPSGAEPGIEKLAMLTHRWIDYVGGEVGGHVGGDLAGGQFTGGCFFWAASAEFDGRPGPVRDRIAESTRYWLFILRDEARLAQRLGEIDSTLDPLQIAFELHAFVQEANWAKQLLEFVDAFDRARASVDACLSRVATSTK